MEIIIHDKDKKTAPGCDHKDCFLCMACMHVCPADVIRLATREGIKRTIHTEIDDEAVYKKILEKRKTTEEFFSQYGI